MIAFPLRLDGSGSLAVVDDFSDAAVRQLARAVVGTRPGERPLAPAYGTPDPTDDADPGVIGALITMCEPEVAVHSVIVDSGRVDVVAQWRQS